MSSDTKKPIILDSEDDGMRTIELHRAESMVKSPKEEEAEEDLKAMPIESNKNIYICITATTTSFLNEIKNMKIEFVMFMYMFSYVMRSVSSTTMIMDKVCLVHLNYSSDICSNLQNHTDAKSIVEKLANNYHLGHSLIQMIPSAFLGCFIGSWSDKYGRKPPVIAAILGIIIDGLGSTFSAAYLHSRVEYYYIPAIFTAFSGGFISVLTVLYSYASDVTTFGKRTMKYAVMELTFGLAMPLGQVAGGWVFRYSGYVEVFLISTAGHVISLAWVLFVLEETRGLDNKDSWKKKFQSLWSFDPVVEGVKATIKRRPNQGREQIFFLILSMSISVLSFAATAGINYFYVHHLYDWDNTKYSTVSAVFSCIGTLCMVVCVAIFKKMQLGDPTLGIVGTTSLLLKNVGIGLASKQGFYYLANLTGLVSGLASLAGRSRISKVVSKDDLGKVFSFLTTAESILPIIAVAVVSQIFNASLDLYPGLIFLVLGGLQLIPLVVYIWLSRLPNVDYEEMHTSESKDNAEYVVKVKTEPQKY